VAGRFTLYTDEDLNGPVVDALQDAGWDLVRAIDLYPEGTPDAVHFERAARDRRALVTNDRRITAIGHAWLGEGRPFRGLICWPRAHYKRMSPRDFVDSFEELAQQDNPFAYPIIHIKPRR
jgi:hypothetical protein